MHTVCSLASEPGSKDLHQKSEWNDETDATDSEFLGKVPAARNHFQGTVQSQIYPCRIPSSYLTDIYKGL